jgi:microcystin-dependent protein
MARLSWISRGVCAMALVCGVSGMASAQEPFIGEIRWVPYTFAPRGWADCNGQLLSIAQNQALFALIGTDYGGDGQVTFALPDMRGRVPMHVGLGPGLSNRVIGEKGGNESHALTIDELPAHSHAAGSHAHPIPALTLDLKASSSAAISTSAAGNVLATVASQGNQKSVTRIYGGGAADVSLGASGATLASATGNASGVTSSAGGDAAHPILSPYLGVRCIIATSGIFPSRP